MKALIARLKKLCFGKSCGATVKMPLAWLKDTSTNINH